MKLISYAEYDHGRTLTSQECAYIFRFTMGGRDVPSELDNVRRDWSLLADKDDPEYYKNWLHVMQMMSELFLRKNKDYGTSNLASGWTQGIAVRLGDKVSRVWNILLNKHQFEVPESVGDTFLDIAAYGVIGYMMESGMWETSEIRHTIGLPALIKYWVSNNDLSADDVDTIISYLVANEIVKEGFPGKLE